MSDVDLICAPCALNFHVHQICSSVGRGFQPIMPLDPGWREGWGGTLEFGLNAHRGECSRGLYIKLVWLGLVEFELFQIVYELELARLFCEPQ
jgi:hypothetical protein